MIDRFCFAAVRSDWFIHFFNLQHYSNPGLVLRGWALVAFLRVVSARVFRRRVKGGGGRRKGNGPPAAVRSEHRCEVWRAILWLPRHHTRGSVGSGTAAGMLMVMHVDGLHRTGARTFVRQRFTSIYGGISAPASSHRRHRLPEAATGFSSRGCWYHQKTCL